MGVGGALGVLTSVILANTLLPAVLAMLGHKIDRGGMRLPQADESFEGQQQTPVARWGRFVTSHPRPVFIDRARASRCCSPRRRSRSASERPTPEPRRRRRRPARRTTSCPTRRTASARASPRRSRSSSRAATADANKVYKALQGLTGPKGNVVFVSKPFANKAGDVAIINAYSRFSPQDAKTDDLVSQLRHTVVPATGRHGVRDRSERRLHGHRKPDPEPAPVVPAVRDRRDHDRPRDGVPLAGDLRQGGPDDAALGVRRVRRPRRRRPARARDGHPRTRQNRSDRGVRPTDRVRDPVRAVDGLRGVPDEPRARGARTRQGHASLAGRRHRRASGA